jgi:hypothetical protein
MRYICITFMLETVTFALLFPYYPISDPILNPGNTGAEFLGKRDYNMLNPQKFGLIPDS